ncbi:MAG TPA: M23 family metallopeptidase [Vicinamibacterales bacterium]|nr:M23 family metallopeptidase [Vicinamibacterales bacterium]
MKGRNARRSWTVAISVTGFFAGAIVMAFVDRGFPHARLSRPWSDAHAADIPLPANPKPVRTLRHDVGPPPVLSAVTMPLVEADPLVDLRSRLLELPVQGAIRGELRDSFEEMRGSTHSHQAIDIMAPRNTPILAVEDGIIARLFDSKAGGTTVYQFDPSTKYVYYYAHLERYADGLREGHHVQRGQILGYVGTSGNAAKDTPHLHFAIFRLTDKKQWWNGRPIDPYTVLK